MTTLQTTGLRDQMTIDGTDITRFPVSVTPQQEILQSVYETLDGGGQLFTPYRAAGYPTQADRYAFSFSWTFDSYNGTMQEFFEKLRSSGGTHTLAIWKPLYLKYSGILGQTLFYLPRNRKNAPSILGKSTVTFPVTFKVGGVSKTIAYKTEAEIAAGTPPANTAWISSDGTTMEYPALAAAATVEVEYFPVFRCYLESPSKSYTRPGVEDIGLTLVEI